MPTIKLLPVLERWECRSCSRCCRGSLIHLDDHDLEKIRGQRWDEDEQFRGTPVLVRESWLQARYRLAQRADGSCVFLTDTGRCRIHEKFGIDAKPLACRMFPLQLVPGEREWLLTVRRACPTAAAEEGAPLETYRATCREWGEEAGLFTAANPPPILPRRAPAWDEFRIVAARLERLLTDSRYPLVRRIVHGLRFCALLEECRLNRLEQAQIAELCDLLCEGATDVSDWFAEREPPAKGSGTLFRQAAAEYLRLHPQFVPSRSWTERWRLARTAIAFARGRGLVPQLPTGFPEVSFESLEQPLGHLDESVQRPLVRFFETHASSGQYALANRPTWSLIESFRALALAYPIGMWILRLSCAGRTPTANDAIDVVTILDRGQGYGPLAAANHRARVRTLARLTAIERLSIWYAR